MSIEERRGQNAVKQAIAEGQSEHTDRTEIEWEQVKQRRIEMLKKDLASQDVAVISSKTPIHGPIHKPGASYNVKTGILTTYESGDESTQVTHDKQISLEEALGVLVGDDDVTITTKESKTKQVLWLHDGE